MSLGCAYENGICSRLHNTTLVNRLNERDISLDVSASAIYMAGIDLNSVVFDKHGYVMNSSSILKDVLDVGLRRLYLDVYYDLANQSWNLCPVPPSVNSTRFNCDYNFNFQDFTDSLLEYINLSDTNIAASLIYLHLSPKIWDLPARYNSTGTGVRSLNETLTNALGSRIMTPQRVRSLELKSKLTHEGINANTPRGHLWPDLRTVIISDKNRLVITFNDTFEHNIPDLSSLQSLAFAQSPTIENVENYTISELNSLNFTDTLVHDLAGWSNARRLGVSPVLADPDFDFYSGAMWDILNYNEYWSWMPGDPQLYSIKERQDMLKNGHIRSSRLEACAVLTPEGFEVANCNAHFPILCKNKTDSFDWVYSNDLHTYFDPDCPKGYTFGLPKTPLEARYIRENVFDEFVNVSWVDFNSLFLPNCWVTGGTNVVCPYNVHEYSRNGIGYIIVASLVAFLGFLTIWLFEWDRRRTSLLKKSFNVTKEYEGIPS